VQQHGKKVFFLAYFIFSIFYFVGRATAGYFNAFGNLWYNIQKMFKRTEQKIVICDTTSYISTFTDGIIAWLVQPCSGMTELVDVFVKCFMVLLFLIFNVINFKRLRSRF
jgi:hypothetical protein